MSAINPTQQSTPSPFGIKGVYFHDGFEMEPRWQAPLYWQREDWEREIRWLSALGLNTVEFATMLEFSRIPTTELERQKIRDRLMILELAHSLGMKFSYLLSNTTVSTVSENEEPSHQGGNRAQDLCPQDPTNFAKTVAIQKWYMHTYREADIFEEFAGDWGGCTCGKCNVSNYLRYVRVFAEELAAVNPQAKLFANTWSIASWGKLYSSENLSWRRYFEAEIPMIREVMRELPALPSNVGLAMPCAYLYRPLVFESYGEKANAPVFPMRSEMEALTQQGREVLAWPHFVMDDDTSRAPAWGVVHSEVRYIRALLQALLDAGINNVMGNLYLPLLQISNTYAYARLLDDPAAAPEAILHDFAGVVARRDDVDALTQVLIWLENNSYWHYQMPAPDRLASLPCDVDKAAALHLMAKIKPNPKPELPLPIAPEKWLECLRYSVEKSKSMEARE
jgi:hypothetical protein